MSVAVPGVILAIDTCGPSGSIALGRVRAHTVELLAQAELPGKTYSAQLIPALRTLLQQQGMEVADLSAIVIVNGPGSFTGVRVGASTAKGLADALGLPVLAVSRLAVLASKASAASTALDAGRNEFYYREGDRESLRSAKDGPLSDVGPVAVCEGTAQQAFANAVQVEPPTAADALRCALPALLARDFADVELLDGNYVRRSDAELFARAAGKV